MIECLERCYCNQHGLGSKPTRAILLCLQEKRFTALSPAWQAVLNFSHTSLKILKNQNKNLNRTAIVLESPEVDGGNCLRNVLPPPSLSCKSGE